MFKSVRLLNHTGGVAAGAASSQLPGWNPDLVCTAGDLQPREEPPPTYLYPTPPTLVLVDLALQDDGSHPCHPGTGPEPIGNKCAMNRELGYGWEPQGIVGNSSRDPGSYVLLLKMGWMWKMPQKYIATLNAEGA